MPYRLKFRYRFTSGEDPRTDIANPANPAGQPFTVVKGRHPQRGRMIATSRAAIRFNDIEHAVGRNRWPRYTLQAHTDIEVTCINLAVVRQRIHAAGLD
ncbi:MULTISPECIES: hypothetical protein [unclassified Mycobacterium]|uniref:hypothetical protein n=1 Tax=unclassified Mycobacterium TaxID=2642494 RepID=UPI0007FF22E9|nr:MULTISPECIES: hypothetical protein [unclassified Mycobacterium]OBG72971.1 hypothetical protein A5700_08030 [Mycobacterium sp. E1214]OBH29166.1 hypothetical protein A5693_20345 [Mycobacterium sp. E1319]